MDCSNAHAWQWLYPPLQSHAHGWLDVGDGHQLYWEVSGNPLGVPALFLHGGPGAGCRADDRRWFDPGHYRIVLFDQRGAGRSRPQGKLQANTTQHLLLDIEALREHLQVDRWLLFGGSWGATLALAYAQAQPQRVRAVVLRGVFLATAAERRWLHAPDGAATWHPAAAQDFVGVLGNRTQAGLLRSYARRLGNGDTAVAQAGELAAAKAWHAWESALMALEQPPSQEGRAPRAARQVDDAAALASARIGVHYARHAYFLSDAQLLADAARLRPLSGVIVQGQRDLVTPPISAQALHRAWPGSRLCRVAAAGHASSHPAMARQLVAATDWCRSAQQPLDTAAMQSRSQDEPPEETQDERCHPER